MSGISESWSLPWHQMQRRVAAGPIAIAPAGSWLVRARSTNLFERRWFAAARAAAKIQSECDAHRRLPRSRQADLSGPAGFDFLADVAQVCCNFENEVQLPPGVPSDPVSGTSLSNE